MAASKIEKAPWVRLGDYIERSMVNNSDLVEEQGKERIQPIFHRYSGIHRVCSLQCGALSQVWPATIGERC